MAGVWCQLGRAGKLGHSCALALLKSHTSGVGSENTIMLTATNMIQAEEYLLLISASSSLAGHWVWSSSWWQLQDFFSWHKWNIYDVGHSGEWMGLSLCCWEGHFLMWWFAWILVAFARYHPGIRVSVNQHRLLTAISVSQSSCTVPGQCSDIIYSQKTVRKRGWYVTNGMSFSTAIVYSLGLLLYLLL